jgi:glutathione S-transferase
MKLFYTPGACSLSPHIVLRELGLPFESERVDLKTKRTETGADYASVNPKGSVPALRLDSGDVLTEGPAVVQYLADLKPEADLAPKNGTLARYRLQEWLNFITTELHKGFGPLFNPATPEAYKTIVKDTLDKKFAYLDGHLAKGGFVLGESFTVADAYAFTVLSWASNFGIDLGHFSNLSAYLARVAARPKVREALEAEGLLKQAA